MKFASTIYFVKGRLKFKNKMIADYTGKTDVSPAPFPSVVVVFDMELGMTWTGGPNHKINGATMTERKTKIMFAVTERTKADFKLQLQYDSLTQVKIFSFNYGRLH